MVENVEATLIADTDFTRHGIILLQDDTTIVGIYGKEIVFRGVRDSNAMSGTSDQLWLLDMDTLLLQSAPTACATVETADDLATMLTQRHGHDDGEQNESFAGRARPTWSKQAVRLARQVIKNFNNTAPRTIMKTIAQGAWRNVPDALDPKIFEDIASRRDNPAYVTAHDRQEFRGGSGIGQEAVGEMVYFDNYGKHTASTYGATFLGEFMDAATGWGIGYGMTTKTSMAAALGKYIAFMKSHNYTVKKACCDDASEVGSRFQLFQGLQTNI